MKKVRTAVAALVIAAGAFGAYAFTNANVETKSSETILHWFDENGNSLGERTQAQQQANCGQPGSQVCAFGYELDQNGEPVGNAVITTKLNP